MAPARIICASCGQAWLADNGFSLHERQAVESCPCPGCGAYTLCYTGPGAAPASPPGAAAPSLQPGLGT